MFKAKENPCVLDIKNRWEVIQRFRDLVNMGPMLQIDMVQEQHKLRVLLHKGGWEPREIVIMEQIAYSYTIYERQIPSKVHERGNYFEYLSVRPRLK